MVIGGVRLWRRTRVVVGDGRLHRRRARLGGGRLALEPMAVILDRVTDRNRADQEGDDADDSQRAQPDPALGFLVEWNIVAAPGVSYPRACRCGPLASGSATLSRAAS